MLVFSRKAGEGVTLGENITVTVIEIRGNRVKLGFSGPRELPIHRQEVFVNLKRPAPRQEDFVNRKETNAPMKCVS